MATREETHRIEGRDVRLVQHEPRQYAYERSRWAVLVDGEQRAWILHPKGFGKPAELWNLTVTPVKGSYPDHRTFLDIANQKTNERQREYLAGRLLDFVQRDRAPTLAEVEGKVEAERLARETSQREYAERRQANARRDADTYEGMVALRERLSRLGVLTNNEAFVLDSAIRDLPSGYQGEVTKELVRRREAREAGEDPEVSTAPSP